MTTIMPHTKEEGEGPSESADEGYAGWTKVELQAELEKRGLPTTGNKPELIAALEEDDGTA